LFLEWFSQVTQKFVSGSSPRHIWKFCLLLIILPLKSLSRVVGRGKHCETHLPCICCQVKSWATPEGSVILLDQNSASVWNIFGGIYTPLLDRISFSSFWIWDMAIFILFKSHHVLIIYIYIYIYILETFIVSLFLSLFYTLGPSSVPLFFILFSYPCWLFFEKMLERSYL
jgi:uncharacterized membrane protein